MGWLEILLLLLLTFAIPVAFMLPFITGISPVGSLLGIPRLRELTQELSRAIGVVWLGFSVWVVTKGPTPTKPITAAAEVLDATPPS